MLLLILLIIRPAIKRVWIWAHYASTQRQTIARMICVSRAFIKAQRAFPTTDVSRHVFVSSFATIALVYLIHNVILFSKCRGGLFLVVDRRLPPKMHTTAKNIIPHKCPPMPADQTEICDGGISVNEPYIFKHFLQNFIWQVGDV